MTTTTIFKQRKVYLHSWKIILVIKLLFFFIIKKCIFYFERLPIAIILSFLFIHVNSVIFFYSTIKL